jgi:hypothetical protein
MGRALGTEGSFTLFTSMVKKGEKTFGGFYSLFIYSG